MILLRVFFGGLFMIGIESIRLLSNKKNYESIIRVLYCLDAIISNVSVHAETWRKIGDKEIMILKHFIDYQLNDNVQKIFDSYIYDTWNCFILHKREICMNLSYVFHQNSNKKMINLLMQGLEIEDRANPKNQPREVHDLTNLFRKELLQIFKYATKMIFGLSQYQSTISDEVDTYKISLWSLLSLIKQTSLKTIILVLGGKEQYYQLVQIYPISLELKAKYSTFGYKISNLIQKQEWNGPNHVQTIQCIIEKLI